MTFHTTRPFRCYLETLGVIPQQPLLTAAQVSAMFSMSPISKINSISCRVVLLIGAKDKRVPPSQGISFHACMRRLGEMNARVMRHASHVARRTSHVTRHTSHVTRHTSHVTGKASELVVLPDCQHSLADKVLQEAHQWIKAAVCMLYPDV